MSLGSDTEVVNGQRFTFPTWSSYAPQQYGPQTTGVPQVSPTMPPYLGGNSSQAGGVMTNVNGYGTADNNTTVTAIAAAHPHNLKVSPVWWAVFALLVSLALLKGVHWRETIDSGAAREDAGGEARA